MDTTDGAELEKLAPAETLNDNGLRLAGWACLLAALSFTAATLLAVYVVRQGNLGEFSPVKLLRFIPQNLALWRTALLLCSLATLSFVVFAVALREVVHQHLRPLFTVAIVFIAIAAANALNAQFSMMVLFSDLALQSHSARTFLPDELAHEGWEVLNQSLTQSVFIANTLNSIGGMLMVICCFLTRSFPRWLAWVGFPIWITALNVSVLAFLGILQWALVLAFASTIAFVIWATVMGLVFRILVRAQQPVSAGTEETALIHP